VGWWVGVLLGWRVVGLAVWRVGVLLDLGVGGLARWLAGRWVGGFGDGDVEP